MAVNPYFVTGGLIGQESEQRLLDDLHMEFIQVYGIDCYYLPRTSVKMDGVYLEDPLVEFNDAVPIEMYLKSFAGFEGDGDFMSHMGIEIRDQVTWTVSITRFLQELGPDTVHKLVRPREGDLIWYPLNQKLFEIRYANKYAMHYPLGSLYTYDLKCELLEYTGQRIKTGIAEIDRITELTQDVLARAVTDENGNPVQTPSGDYVVNDGYDPARIDPLDDSSRIQTESDEIVDFSEIDVYSEGKW